MTLIAPAVDYTAVDFDSLRARLVQLVESVFPEWTDHDVANFGNVLVELFAFVGDVLGYYLDTQAREAFLATALRRENVIALARRLGYRLSGATAATAELEFRLPVPPRARVVLAAGSVVRTREAQDPVRFQLLEELVRVRRRRRAAAVSGAGRCRRSRSPRRAFRSARRRWAWAIRRRGLPGRGALHLAPQSRQPGGCLLPAPVGHRGR